jgi:hypothetical protein
VPGFVQSASVWQKSSAMTVGSHFLAVLRTEKRSQPWPLGVLQSESCEQYCGQSKRL